MLYPTTEEGKETMRIKDKHIKVSRLVQEINPTTKSVHVVHEKIELGVGVNAGTNGRKNRRHLNRGERSSVHMKLSKIALEGTCGNHDVVDELLTPQPRRTLGRRNNVVRRLKGDASDPVLATA